MLQKVFLVVCLLSTCSHYCGALDVKIGIVFTHNQCCDFRSFEDKASAMNIAADSLVADGVLDNNTVSFKYILTDASNESKAAGVAIDTILDQHVDALFGASESKLTISMGHITDAYNIPHLSWLSNSLTLSNKTMFRTLVRTFGLLSNVGQLAVTLHKEFGWQRAGILYANRDLCRYIVIGLKEKFAENNLTFTQTTSFSERLVLTDEVIDGFLREMRTTSRIIYICDYYGIRTFMVRACRLGMCGGDYVFIYPSMGPPYKGEWPRGDGKDDVAKEAYKHVIHIATGWWQGEEGERQVKVFTDQVLDRMALPPWNSTLARHQNNPASNHAIHIYDAMYLYGMWLNHSLTNNLDHRDGQAWFQFARNRTFPGMGSPVDINSNGDRIPFFWVYQFQGDDVVEVKVAESTNKNNVLIKLQEFVWYTDDGNPPKDYPECGWFNELCPPPPPEPGNDLLVTVLSLVVFGCLTGSIMTGFAVRRRKLELKLLERIWRININDLELMRARSWIGSKMLMKPSVAALSIGSSISDTGASQEDSSGQSISEQARALINAATYKGQIVVIKAVPAKTVFKRDELQDLKTMREFMHDNVNSFIGASFDTASPCMLFLYCPKGSLQDILENEDIQLDLNFKISLTIDLVQGIQCIHNSQLGSHGRLKSSNCLVDNRWMLKVTDYGTARFLDTIENEENIEEEQQHYKSLLWTSPELLASPKSNPKGTKAGDIYSLGVIVHEIFYRMGPFAGNGFLTTKDIIARVKSRDEPLCRPTIFNDHRDVIPQIVKLMSKCWQDGACDRPNIAEVRSYIRKNIKQATSINIVDLMLQRLEKYSTNLEDLVDQRTQQLLQEKQKSDKLLYRLLPRSCAEKLKAGDHVVPEVFDEATLFFSDIVGFTKISSRSSPMQVVSLLNDLYVCFDSIIHKYDAYKVETIGDAYLVVSGVPNRNGHLHAAYIADMSMDIMAAIGHFTISHLPEVELLVRIGLHTGACCAGIVGMSMPRYCLFGDTVNITSKMESTGSARRIHISETTDAALRKIGGYDTELREDNAIQGIGTMKTYWLLGKRGNRLMDHNV